MTLSALSLLGLLAMIAAVVALYPMHALLGRGPIGIAAQVLAIALTLWARLTFGLRSFHAAANPTEGGLVTTGPYRFIRHPIYAAALLFIGTGVVSNASPIGFALFVVAAVGVALRITAEERMVVARYPEYAQYAARVKRLIPFVL
jgi:protein-S-isoprenylcysteine O-methyltransferase Ste14